MDESAKMWRSQDYDGFTRTFIASVTESTMDNADLLSFNSSQCSQMSVPRYPMKFERSKVLIEFMLQWQIFPEESPNKRASMDINEFDNM